MDIELEPRWNHVCQRFIFTQEAAVFGWKPMIALGPWLVPLSVTPSCFPLFLPSGFVPNLANIPTPSSWFGKTMTNLRVTGISSTQLSDNTQTVYRCIQYICWSPLNWDINIILTKTKAIEITTKTQDKPMRSQRLLHNHATQRRGFMAGSNTGPNWALIHGVEDSKY